MSSKRETGGTDLKPYRLHQEWVGKRRLLYYAIYLLFVELFADVLSVTM